MRKEVFELLRGAIENAAEATNYKMVKQSGAGNYLNACSYAEDLASFFNFLHCICHIDNVHELKEIDDWGFIKWWALNDDGIKYIHEYAEDNDLEDFEDEVIKLFD